tara:strand:- start:806 stop:1057 length:252 start_codon:yes stop_codon:yes gene_type:complete
MVDQVVVVILMIHHNQKLEVLLLLEQVMDQQFKDLLEEHLNMDHQDMVAEAEVVPQKQETLMGMDMVEMVCRLELLVHQQLLV